MAKAEHIQYMYTCHLVRAKSGMRMYRNKNQKEKNELKGNVKHENVCASQKVGPKQG